MPYSHIPGVKASYLDGAFKIPTGSTQPKVLVVGPAESGLTNEIFNVAAVSGAESEFGAETPVLRVTHELLAQLADNIAIVRSGGRQGSLVVEDSAGGTLTITPEYRDDEILERYALVIENDGSVNRFLVYDLIDQAWVYDSSEIEVLDAGVVTVEDDDLDLFTLNDRTVPDLAISMADLVTGDFTADGSATLSTLTITEGSDGMVPSLVERYAAYNTTLHMLDYKDADFVIPVDAYIDDANVVDDASPATYGYYWLGVPVAGDECDKLGYLWQYIYRGRIFTYFTDTADYFSVATAAASKTVNTDLVITALREGKGGNACTLQIALGGSLAVSITENANCGLDILLTAVSGVTTNADAATAIDAALLAFTASTGTNGAALLDATGGSTVISATVAKSNFTGGTGGHVLTHEDLTGDTIPSAVSTKFAAAVNAELRECNFAHQVASFCYLASTNWATMLGAVSFKAPTAFGRLAVADWVGTLPEYTDNGQYLFIDAPADNGAAILGNKFLAGQSKTSAGYRSGLVTDGNTTDGYAYGGLILTTGSALPNGSDWPYGIDDDDEALDSGRKPIDIGKHVFITYDWPIHSNGYNGGSTYRGSLPGAFVGKVVGMAENEEPIGDNGTIRKVQSPPRIHSTQLDDLASIRAIGLRRDETVGLILVSARTAAHPDSDYTRISTIRSVNRMLKGIRNIARPYIGKPFNAQQLVSLQSAIDQYLVAEKAAGFNQGAKASISYSRADKIMGRLKVKVRMIPPFSVETIDVETSLAAEESEL